MSNDPVGKQPPFAQVDGDITREHVHQFGSFDQQGVARPDAGNHAAAQSLESSCAVLGDNLRE